jgi:polyisoprenoid-binding protein YceI
VVPQQKVIKATGNLTIAGVTKPVALQTTYTVNGDEVVCKGSKTLKMSEYGIKAPTFMMGALKVADEVTIDLSLKLKN